MSATLVTTLRQNVIDSFSQIFIGKCIEASKNGLGEYMHTFYSILDFGFKHEIEDIVRDAHLGFKWKDDPDEDKTYIYIYWLNLH